MSPTFPHWSRGGRDSGFDELTCAYNSYLMTEPCLDRPSSLNVHLITTPWSAALAWTLGTGNVGDRGLAVPALGKLFENVVAGGVTTLVTDEPVEKGGDGAACKLVVCRLEDTWAVELEVTVVCFWEAGVVVIAGGVVELGVDVRVNDV